MEIQIDFKQIDISDTTSWCVHNRLHNANFDAKLKKKKKQPLYSYTGCHRTRSPEKLTNADDNLDPKNAKEEKLMACITQ
jgi:hypothetical protein